MVGDFDDDISVGNGTRQRHFGEKMFGNIRSTLQPSLGMVLAVFIYLEFGRKPHQMNPKHVVFSRSRVQTDLIDWRGAILQ